MPRSTGPSRRAFLAGAATAIAAGGLPVAFPRRSPAAPPVLRIAQWAHFVPAYDDWFDRKFAREWGQRNGVTVEIDHLSLSELRVRADTEVATQQGHDLFAFPESPVGVRAARDALDRRRDGVRAPVRAPPGLHPEGHVQP